MDQYNVYGGTCKESVTAQIENLASWLQELSVWEVISHTEYNNVQQTCSIQYNIILNKNQILYFFI